MVMLSTVKLYKCENVCFYLRYMTRYILQAWHSSNTHTPQEVELYRHYSRDNKYLSIITSTNDPTVSYVY